MSSNRIPFSVFYQKQPDLDELEPAPADEELEPASVVEETKQMEEKVKLTIQTRQTRRDNYKKKVFLLN